MKMRTTNIAFAITMMSLVMVGLVPACCAQTASASLKTQAANTLVSTPAVGSPLSTPPVPEASQPSSVYREAPLLAGLVTAGKLPAIDKRLPVDRSACSLPPCATSGGNEACIRIGVLAKRGRQHCLDQWGPTAAYLAQQIPECSFSILPLDFDHIFEAVANQEVDFIFANSSFYVELEVRFGVTRIATLNNLHSDGTAHAVFAGVIFTRADRGDINGLKDLKDKSVMAVDERSLGGWHMQWREMKAQGIDPYHDFKTLTYGGTHDAVVYAVRDRTVDAGCVRSDTLERMELEGKAALAQFKLITTHDHCNGNVRFLHSTRHYPEWPLAKSPHTGEALAKQVAVALMRMPASSPAAVAGNYAGWTIPQNYQPVHECLMELHLPPYQNYGKVTLGDFWRQYWPWLLGIAAMLTLIAAGAVYASRLQSRLRQSVLAQKERERAQAFLQTVIDGFPEALMVINDDYTVTLANHTVLTMAGARDLVEDCLKCHQVSHNRDQPCSGEEHPCPFDRVFKTKRPVTLEHIHHGNTGEERIVELIAAPIFDEKGTVVKIIESCRDITDRKRAEEKLKASEERLRLTLEATQIGIWDWDVANDRYLASPIYYTMLGYEPKEGPADRSEWVQQLHPDDKKTVLEQVNKVLSRTCDEYSYEARFRHADGSYKWQWAFGYGAGQDKDGKLTRMLGLRIDIDRRKRMEEELSIHRQHLEKLVRERTMELEAANKELDAFAYSVSHDLRAPLRHVDGFLELLQKKAGAALDEQGRHYMDAISEAARKMGLLIDDLLSFSRMGRHGISFQPVDLGTLVRDVIRELTPEAAGRNIEWRVGDLPAVGGDAAMLRIVLTNLIANALKFTRPRQQALIEIGSLPGQDSEAVVFVRDNGVGFDMTYVDKLFGVFQRLHRADEFEGTGIGLANVRRIITRHGGRTWAEGKPDQGAAFYFALPHTPRGGGDE
jgi:PAS domain S-box-containing protein